MEQSQALMGHNNPPSDGELLREHLEEETRPITDRAQALINAADRVPEKIEDDETEAKVTELISQMTKVNKALEAKRVDKKAPYLELSRAVDGFFKVQTDALDNAKRSVKRLLDQRLREKAEAERKRREEEAAELRRKAQQEAEEAAAQEAAKQTIQSEETMDKAVQTERLAAKTEESANDKLAKLAKSRGNDGSTASLRTTWKGELVSREMLDLEKLRQHLPEAALQQAINSFVKAGGRDLKGARIWEHSESVVR